MEPIHFNGPVSSSIVNEAMAMRVSFFFDSGMYVVPGLTQESADDIFQQLARTDKYICIDDDVIFVEKLTHVKVEKEEQDKQPKGLFGYSLILRCDPVLGGLKLEELSRNFDEPEEDDQLDDGNFWFKYKFYFRRKEDIPAKLLPFFVNTRKLDVLYGSQARDFNAVFPDFEKVLVEHLGDYRWSWDDHRTLTQDFDDNDFEELLGDKPQNECYNLEEEVEEDRQLFKYCIYKHEDVIESRCVNSWEKCKELIKKHGWEMGSAYSTQQTKWFANLYREDYGSVSLVFVQVR